MLARCFNPNDGHFSGYGARGITACDRWNDFANFLADMGERPRCKVVRPRAHPSILLPQQRCRVDGYRDPRPYDRAELNFEPAKEADFMNDETTEALIQKNGLSAPRVTLDHIKSLIVGETFTKLPSGKVLVCELTLKNGFTVRGEAAVVSRENFNEEVGQKVSRENAINQVWQLEGYLLQERLAG